MRERFTEALAERLPAFEPTKVDAPVLFGGQTVFRRALCDGLHVFVVLTPDAKGRQAFTVELAWSTSARFPEVTMSPSLMLGPDDPDPIDQDEAIVRLGGLAERADRWWDLPDPARSKPGDLEALRRSLEPVPHDVARRRAARPVNAAVSMLVESGVPFLEALASRWCGS